MKNRQAKIEQTLVSTSTVNLQNKLEEEWATLDSEIEVLQDELINDKFSKERMQSLLQKTRVLFEEPIAIRTLGNSIMKQLLIKVRF